MAFLHASLLLVLVAGAAAATVTPVEKVISLVTDLKTEVEQEGASESKTYEQFACFCKDTTMKKSKSVNRLHDKIDDLSADIGDKTQTKKDDSTDLSNRMKDQEKLSKDLDDHNAQCTKDKAAYETENADLTKAVSGLTSAVKAMKKTGGASAASLLAVKSVLSLQRSSAKTQSNIAALQKVDPEDPEYDYHSNDIVKLCESLLVDFKSERHDLNTEWGKTDKACKETRKALGDEMTSNKRAMDALDKKIESNLKSIAEDREALVQADGDLKDDKLYLRDLTARCEERANDYDQRSQMRGGELKALTTALGVLTGDVKGADEQVNKRALLLQKASVGKKESKVVEVHSPVVKSLSFLQNALENHEAAGFLARASDNLSLEAKKNRAVSMLRLEGRRIGSLALAALAGRAAADPFKKVKNLIQKLIERLLQESAAEATKKGFCDTEIGKAEHERDARYEEAGDLNRELKALEAKEDELSEEIETLKKDIKDTTKDLKDATTDRNKEKADNAVAISVATEGNEAVTSALATLKSFYSGAVKASAFIQASPLDEDTQGAGFAGNYQGKQGGMNAVFALLETIQSDFDRTIRTTEKEETAAHRAFVEFSQTSKSSIAGKSTKLELDTQDLKSTKTSIEEKMNQLSETTDLLDLALKELEKLKPTCIDTGMSYEDRVKKREDEMAALKKALCILDTDKVESECK